MITWDPFLKNFKTRAGVIGTTSVYSRLSLRESSYSWAQPKFLCMDPREMTPEDRKKMREKMRGRPASSVEDDPEQQKGTRYAVFQETHPTSGQVVHGVHRIQSSGSVDSRATSYHEDPNEAQEEAEHRNVKSAYKSLAAYRRNKEKLLKKATPKEAMCSCCDELRSECTCPKDCKSCSCHRPKKKTQKSFRAFYTESL